MSILKKLLDKIFVFKVIPFNPRINTPGSVIKMNIENDDRKSNKGKVEDSRTKYNRTQHK